MTDMKEILAASYRFEEPMPEMTRQNTVLLLIDIQHLASAEYLHEKATNAGFQSDEARSALSDYKSRFDAAAEACSAVLKSARSNGIIPIHVKIEAQSSTARDTGAAHSRMGWKFPPGSAAAKFLPCVEPEAGEIVLTKTVSGAFSGTNLDSVLRHMKVDYIYLCGFVTDECVETTARVSLDLGYTTYIISDATTAYFKESWEHVIQKFGSWGLIKTSGRVDSEFGELRSGT